MNKFKLTDWAAIAEVAGTAGIVLSLIFVAYGIDRNNDELRASHGTYVYDTARDIELLVAADPEWSRIIIQGRTHESQLSELEQYRYDAYLTAQLDIWDEILARYDDGLLDEVALFNWENYFANWVKRNMTSSDWRRLEWQYGGTGIDAKVKAALSAKSRE